MTILYVILGALGLLVGAFLLGVYVVGKVLNGLVDSTAKTFWR